MKKYIYLFLTLFLLSTSCAMFKREAERSIKKDVAEFLDENFDSYAKNYHAKRTEEYRKHIQWIVSMLASGLGGIATAAGLYSLHKKIKNGKKNKGDLNER